MISSSRDPLSPCILVVDDDAALRRILARILTEEGYRVLTAPNGEEALAIASPLAGHLPLVITDVQMPVMNGLELAAQLNRLRPPPKLLFMSGYSAPHVEVNGSFLAKPFSPDILVSRVRQLLAVPNGLTAVSGGG
jgi:two-component system, cell cycle sensor histidine kinase and response regulator CckA